MDLSFWRPIYIGMLVVKSVFFRYSPCLALALAVSKQVICYFKTVSQLIYMSQRLAGYPKKFRSESEER